MSDRIFKDSEGTPANYGDTVELIKDKLGNDRLGPDKSNETAPYSYAGPIPELEDGGYVIQRMEDGNTNNYIDVAVTGWYQVKFRVEADSTLPGNTISFRDGSSTIAGSVYPGDPRSYIISPAASGGREGLGTAQKLPFFPSANSPATTLSSPAHHSSQCWAVCR